MRHFNTTANSFATRNSIIARNNADNTDPDVRGDSGFVSRGNNFIGNPGTTTVAYVNGVNNDQVGTAAAPIDPQFGVLDGNGGFTETHRLDQDSTAVNAGQNCVTTATCGTSNPPVPLVTDQRGATRRASGAVDIGAFEVAPFVTNSPYGTTLNNALADTGDGSLRREIADAAATDTIYFDPSFFTNAVARVITLTSGELLINKSVAIIGTGARNLTVRRSTAAGTANFRIFMVNNAFLAQISNIAITDGNPTDSGGGVRNNGGTNLLLESVAVTGNSTPGGSFDGGGVFNTGNGITTILNSIVSDNTASRFGGGIRVSSGTVNIANSTISGNIVSGGASGGGGGGIDINGTINLNNVTITGNEALGSGSTNAGGVYNAGTVNPRNTIIAGNSVTSGNPDITGPFASNGNNLVGNTTGGTGFSAAMNDKLNVSALLAPLANNGGQTDAHALLESSPALDGGNNCVVTAACGTNNPPVALTADQRGSSRLEDGGVPLTGFAPEALRVDIGAYEAATPPPTAAAVTIGGRVTTPTGRGLRNVLVSMTDESGERRTVTTGAFGYYRFTEVEAGKTYLFIVYSKRYSFTQQVVTALEETENLDFSALP